MGVWGWADSRLGLCHWLMAMIGFRARQSTGHTALGVADGDGGVPRQPGSASVDGGSPLICTPASSDSACRLLLWPSGLEDSTKSP